MSDGIDSVRTAVYTVPTEEPETDGTHWWDHTTVVTVHVSARGQTGLGFTYGPAACAAIVNDVLAGVVAGSDPMDVAATWAAMVRTIRNDGRPGVVSMAIAAVDTALWDLRARLMDLALFRLLGAARTSVPIYGSGGFTSLTPDGLCRQLAGWANGDGIPRVKMKVATGWGTDLQRDLDRARVARDAIGPGTELYVDANGGYTRKQAVRAARAYADLGVTWFEEPVSSDDLAGLHEVRSAIAPEVAAGEYGYDLAYFGHLCAAGAVDVVQADVSRCAGVTEWLRVAAVAAAHGLDISGHCAQSLHAHVACAVPNLRHLEYFADHARVDRALFDGVVDPSGGEVRPDPDRPGLGLSVSSAAQQFRIG